MIEELLAKIDSAEFEDTESWLYIDAITWQQDTLSLTLELYWDDHAVEHWLVSCDLVLSYDFQSRKHGTLSIESNHPVLWPHNSAHEELYFSSAPKDAASVFGSLLEAHIELVDAWYPISRFVNPYLPTIKLLSSGNGLLASGPAPIIEQLEVVLKQYDIRHNCLQRRSGIITYNTDLKPIALVFDDSFVAAHKIEAHQIAPK